MNAYRTLKLLSIIALGLLFISCSNDNDKKDWSEVVNLYVSSETGEYTPWWWEDFYVKLEGMKIRENESEDWQVVHFETIEGFTFEKGYRYYLKTEKIHLANPPQDGSNIRYKLIEVLSKELSLFSIEGSKVGYDGAQYTLSNADGNVNWNSSDNKIATISSDGILTIKGKGVVILTAQYMGDIYSRVIMIGVPEFSLSASFEPGGYEIRAECNDPQYNYYLTQLDDVLKFHWGFQYPNEKTSWVEVNDPNIKLVLKEQHEKIIVFLEVIDALGNKSELLHIEIDSPETEVYTIENNNLFIDSQGVLYKENMEEYLYNSARLYLTYKTNIPEKYKERNWMATTAMVVTPFSQTTHTIDARNGGPLVKDILLESELEQIKNSSVDNQVYKYTLVLLNYEAESIQFVPVTFTYRKEI